MVALDYTLAAPRDGQTWRVRRPGIIGLPRGADWRNRASVYTTRRPATNIAR
jgi:hypothetical protein